MGQMDEFPPNTNRSKEPKPEKKIEKVVTGPVIEKKKPFGIRVKELFFGGEAKTAGRYIVAEVLLPAVRNMIVEATSKGVERMIYGDQIPRRPLSGGLGQIHRTAYRTPSTQYSPTGRTFLPGQSRQVPLRKQDLQDFVLASREEADLVVETLAQIIDTYQQASMADLKNMLDLPTTFVDQNWGWTDLHMVDMHQTRDGWLISMPHPEPL